MPQLTLEFVKEEAESPAVRLAPEVQREVVSLMAELITAMAREPQGENDEKRSDRE